MTQKATRLDESIARIENDLVLAKSKTGNPREVKALELTLAVLKKLKKRKKEKPH